MNNFLSSNTAQKSTDRLWQYAIWLLYMVGSLVLVLHHEIWKDEAHHWLLARDSNSLSDLIHNARYEGHPKLWNILMFCIGKFTHDPLYMQLLNWCMGLAAIWFLIFRSPFPRWVRYLLPFTYLLFYEYQVISRNYAICILLLFMICHQLCQQEVRYWLLGLLMALLANVSLFGLIIAKGISLGIAYHYIDLKKHKFNFKPLVAFIIICLVGFTLSVYQIIPPPDHFLTANHNNAGLFSGTRINKLLSILFRGTFHIPNIGEPSVWNSNLIFFHIPDIAKVLLSLLAWTLPFVFFFRFKKLLLLFLFSLGGIALFAYISPLILSVRHSGFSFILMIICFWLAHSGIFNQKTSETPIDLHSGLLAGIIGINVLSALIFSYIELTRPFSMSSAVVNYLLEQGLESLPMVSTQNTGVSLSAYMERPLYYMDKGSMGSYAVWSADAFTFEKTTLDRNLKRFAEHQNEFIIASEYNYSEDFLGSCWHLEHLKPFKGSIVQSEQFEVFHAKKICD